MVVFFVLARQRKDDNNSLMRSEGEDAKQQIEYKGQKIFFLSSENE